MIEEAYVSYDIARRLKDKGFNVAVNRFYDVSFVEPTMVRSEFCRNSYTNNYAAPTQQLAMRWLREEKDIFLQVNKVGKEFTCGVWYKDTFIGEIYDGLLFETYELAVSFGLLYALTEME